MLKKIALVVALIVLAAGILAVVFRDYLARKAVENEVQRQLVGVLGPAERYDVRVSGRISELSRGQVPRMQISGTRVQLSNGLVAESLTADARNIMANFRTGTISGVQNASFRAVLSDADLTEYLATKHPEVPDLRVRMIDSQLVIAGRPGVGSLAVDVTATGTVEVRENRQLLVKLRSADAEGVDAPPAVRTALEKLLNPVIDTSRWSVPARLESARVAPGRLTITGSLNFWNRPQAGR